MIARTCTDLELIRFIDQSKAIDNPFVRELLERFVHAKNDDSNSNWTSGDVGVNRHEAKFNV